MCLGQKPQLDGLNQTNYCRSLIGILTSFSLVVTMLQDSHHHVLSLFDVYCKYKTLIPLLGILACAYVVWWSVATLTESLSVLIYMLCWWLFIIYVFCYSSLAWSSSLALLMYQPTMLRYWGTPTYQLCSKDVYQSTSMQITCSP